MVRAACSSLLPRKCLGPSTQRGGELSGQTPIEHVSLQGMIIRYNHKDISEEVYPEKPMQLHDWLIVIGKAI